MKKNDHSLVIFDCIRWFRKFVYFSRVKWNDKFVHKSVFLINYVLTILFDDFLPSFEKI